MWTWAKYIEVFPKDQSPNQFLCHFYLWPSVYSNKQLSQSICWWHWECTALIRVVKPSTDVAISTLEADLMRGLKGINSKWMWLNSTPDSKQKRKEKRDTEKINLEWIHIVPQMLPLTSTWCGKDYFQNVHCCVKWASPISGGSVLTFQEIKGRPFIGHFSFLT